MHCATLKLLWQAALILLCTTVAAQPIQGANLVPAQLPVVLWHGMGDSCCASYSLGAVKKQIQDVLDGTSSILQRSSPDAHGKAHSGSESRFKLDCLGIVI